MSYRNNNSRRERSRESSPIYNRPPHDDYRSKPRDVISPSEFQRRIDPGVPKSKHSVQIKGLPSNIRSYEVEDFLQKRVGGPLKTIYFKPDIKNDETVIAIRFEDKEKAKICVDSLHKTIMLGSKIFIDYYQDFNRHNDYIEKKQQKEDEYRPRGRSRDRSPIRSGRSRSPNVSQSRSRFDRPDNFYAPPPIEYRNEKSIPVYNNEKISQIPDYRNERSRPPPDYIAERSTSLSDYRNESRNYFEDEREARRSPPTNNNLVRRPPLLPAPSSSSPMEAVVIPMDIHSKSSFSQLPMAPAPYPIAGPLHSNTRPPSNLPPPGFSSILPISKDHLPSTNSSKFSSTNFPNMKSNTTPEPKLNDQTWRTPDPDTFSAARLNTVQTLKYQQPQEKKNDIQGLFRLGTVSVEATKNEMRKEKLYRLTPHARTKVEEKKRELLKAYEDDCKTYGFLTQSLINKNSNLEESLRVALAEVLKDLEEGYKKTLDDFIDIFLSE